MLNGVLFWNISSNSCWMTGSGSRISVVWIVVCLILTFCGVSVRGISSHKKTAYIDGDIMIGALFSIHEAPEHRGAYSGERICGKIWEQYGIQRMEAAIRTINAINRNPKLLPNITLGVEIRDDCWHSPVALEQTIEFIRESIAAQTGNGEKSDQTESEICLSTVTESSGVAPAPRVKKKKNFVGVVGPGSSSVTIQVQNLLQLFNIPQIGYSATSPDLSDKTSYKYFLRVVPSDRFQAAVMLDLILYHNWTYISAVCTKGSYGTSGMEAFKSLAKERQSGICIATEDTLSFNAEEKEYERVVLNFLKFFPNAKVIACFCEGKTVTGLFNAMRRLGESGKLLLIGSDGWADRLDVVHGIEEEVVGGISIRIQSPYIGWFDELYKPLNPRTHKDNPYNPWFKEFWSERFDCLLPDSADSPSYSYETMYRPNRTCTGRERLTDYKQDAKMGFVIDSIYTLAHGLHRMHADICGGAPGLCAEMATINGSLFLEYLMGVNFTGVSGHEMSFDANGDPPGRYDIMNFQERKGVYAYHKIGQWDNGKLQLALPFQWNRDNEFLNVVESVCSQPCKRGEVKAIQTGGVKCCWVCTACKLNEFLLDEFTCEACPAGWLPNSNLTACLPITLEYVSWDSSQSVLAISFSCLGFLATAFTMAVFILHNHTTVVKASTRELSYIILVGIAIAYATTFPLVAKPTMITCYLTRIFPGFSFAMIYGALVTKTNRIARILAAGKKKIMTRKPRFMSALAQVVITWIIIGIETAILSAVLFKEPADSLLHFPELNRARLICNTSALGLIAPMGFDFFLIAMCTLYAIKTRNLPENFNEAKFIGFTMYTTCVIWLAFLPIYFGSDQKVLTMCLCISFSATVALVFLFFPKLYIILLRPERNTRSAFTTTNQVRVHIGSNNLTKSIDSNSCERPYASTFRRPGRTSTNNSVSRVPSVLRRFSMRRPKRTTEIVLNNVSIDSPSSSLSIDTHVYEPKQQVYNTNKMVVQRRQLLTRMSDVLEETSTAFREDSPDGPKRIHVECQTTHDLLQPYIEQYANNPTPNLRRRRRSLLLMCNEIEEELLCPASSTSKSGRSDQSDKAGKASRGSSFGDSRNKVDPMARPSSTDDVQRRYAVLDRNESGSNLTMVSLPDEGPPTLTSSRVSLSSFGGSSVHMLTQLNGSDPAKDTESLRNLREWLAEQGILLTDLETSLI